MAGKSDIRAGSAFVELFVKGAQFERGLNAASAKIKKFGESITAVGRRLSAFGLVAGTGLGLAVKRFADFDDQMRAVGAVAQSTDAQLQKLTNTAEKLGAATSFTAVEVGLLMTELGRAGFNAPQVEKLTGSVLSLARATKTDATLAAGIMSAAIRQFGLQAEDGARVADVLTVAANKSFNTIETLGEGLKYAGPVAKDFNMSIEDTLAIFGGLGNMGIQGSNAGTAVRRLLTMTGAEAEKMKVIFGVSFKDAVGNTRPLIDTLEEVNAATRELGSADRAAKFFEAFGLLGITAASAIGQASVSIRELKTELDNAGGVAEDTAKQMDAGLGGSIRIMLSAAESVAIKFGRALAPALQKVGVVIIDLLQKIGQFIDQNRELTVVVSTAIIGVGAFGVALVALGTALSLASFALSTLATVVGGIISVVSSLGAAIAFLATPVGIAVAGFVAIDAAIVALGASLIYASGIVPQLVAALQPLLGAIGALSTALMSGDFSKAWDIAATSAKLFGSVAMDVFDQLPEFAGYAAGRIAKAFVDAFKAAWEWISSTQGRVFSGMLSTAARFSPALLKAMFTGDFAGAAASIALSMRSVIDDVVTSAAAFGEGFAGLDAPTLATSDRTKGLTDALKKMSAPAGASGKTSAAKPATFGSMGDPFGEGTARVGGGPPGSLGGAFSGGGTQPSLDLTPLEQYEARVDELSEAVSNGGLSFEDFNTQVARAREKLFDLSPLEKYTSRMKELQTLFDEGLIDESKFKLAAMDALPNNVKDIIERSKTPLEKFNEQITEARDALNAGLINPNQFASEQERLQKEFRGDDQKALEKAKENGRVSVGFSAAGLIAQGIGGGQGGKDAIPNKLQQQLDEAKKQTDALKKIEVAVGKGKLVFG